MDIAHRVRMKSDRPGRVLVIALCVAPVAAPLTAAALNLLLKEIPPPAHTAAVPETPPPAPRAVVEAPRDAVFSPEPMAGRLAPQIAPPPAPVVKASAPAPARAPLTGSHVLRNVTIVDGLRIAADGMVVALAGVGPVPPGSECKRIDGVVEPCATRAAHRLEILTRGRPVVCEMRAGDAKEARGVCRAGKIDLADDLVRNGLALRTTDRL